MTQFRKKPVEVEARQFDGTFEHACQLREWIGVNASAFCDSLRVDPPLGHLEIRTLEGAMRAEPFDWIIRGVKGEFYPCKPDIFAVTYESVDLSASPCAQETPPAEVIDQIEGEWAMRAVEYARAQVGPHYGPNDDPTPYAKGIIQRLAATYRDGYLTACEALRSKVPPAAALRESPPPAAAKDEMPAVDLLLQSLKAKRQPARDFNPDQLVYNIVNADAVIRRLVKALKSPPPAAETPPSTEAVIDQLRAELRTQMEARFAVEAELDALKTQNIVNERA